MARGYRILFVAILILTGCATAPPQRTVSDFKTIAGTWKGYNDAGQPVTLIIQNDGRFDAIITTPLETFRRKGAIRIDGQELSYDADLSYGKVTYHEGDGRRRLFLHGTLKQGGGKFVTEYSPSSQ